MPPRTGLDERALRQLDQAYLHGMGAVLGSSAFGEYAQRKDLGLLCCGAPIGSFNVAHLAQPVLAPETLLPAAEAWFAERRNLPFQIEVRVPPEEPSATRALERAGYEYAGDPIPGMVLGPDAKLPDPPSGLRIEHVTSSEDLDVFARTAFRGFGFPEKAADRMLTARLLERPDAALLLGRADHVPVATSMLVLSGGIAGIYWVATEPEARGRGYGAALTAAAVAEGRLRGGSLASLQASAMGRPVYERMGFEHVVDYRRWARPDAS